jgi:hypothetical protein
MVNRQAILEACPDALAGSITTRTGQAPHQDLKDPAAGAQAVARATRPHHGRARRP